MHKKPLKEKAKLCIAISSRALFDLEDDHKYFTEHGPEKYMQHQRQKEQEPLTPGSAFNMVKKFLALNEIAEDNVEVVLVSRNSFDTGVRIFNSIKHHKLSILRSCFCDGNSPFKYLASFRTDLFLSQNPDDVRLAIEANHAAAHILPRPYTSSTDDTLNIAFDGDAVIFSDAAEKLYKNQGFESFINHEHDNAKLPMAQGPFAGFLQALYALQTTLPIEKCPIRTALVTARSAPAHERVIRTLRAWNIRLDETLFLGGLDKGGFLEAFAADIFFDDQAVHCLSANQHVPTGQVIYAED